MGPTGPADAANGSAIGTEIVIVIGIGSAIGTEIVIEIGIGIWNWNRDRDASDESDNVSGSRSTLQVVTLFGLFWPFLLVRPVSAKTATFWPRSHQNARLTAQCDGT